MASKRLFLVPSVALAAVLIVGFATSASARRATATRTASQLSLPAPVTFAGVGGVRIGMESKQVARLLGHAPTVVVESGSSADLYMPICAGRMQGVAGFKGADTNLDNPTGNTLLWIWFRTGARTTLGVGTGSTRARVVRAYGQQLHRESGGLYLAGPKVKIYESSLVTPVIYFYFNRGNTVSALGYGAKQPLVDGYSPRVAGFC